MADRASRAISVLQRAGFTGERLKVAFAIVMRESGGNPRAHNPNRATGDDSYGLAQINMLGSMGPARRRALGIQSNEQLLDPAVNARAMFQMSRGGKDFGAWGIGPNAYRQGAGLETIRPFLKQFPGTPPPGVGEPPPAARTPHRAPGAINLPAPDPRFAIEMIARSRTRRDAPVREANPMDSWPLPQVDASGGDREDRVSRGRPTDFTELLNRAAMREATHPFLTRDAPAFRTRGAPGDLKRAAAKGADVRLPARFRPTHKTDNLGWPAVDIMGKPGARVGSPVSGTVVRHGSAQGGEALYIDGPDPDKKPDWWVGHVENRAPVGTRVKRGQTIASISGKHPRPHVHLARRGR